MITYHLLLIKYSKMKIITIITIDLHVKMISAIFYF